MRLQHVVEITDEKFRIRLSLVTHRQNERHAECQQERAKTANVHPPMIDARTDHIPKQENQTDPMVLAVWLTVT